MPGKGPRGTAECRRCEVRKARKEFFDGAVYRKTCNPCREALAASTEEKKCYLCKKILPMCAFVSKVDPEVTCKSCVDCRDRVDTWQKNNPDRLHVYYMENADERKKRASDWYYTNHEYALKRNREYARKSKEADPEAWRAKQREYQQTWLSKPGNKQKRQALVSAWMKNNRDRMNVAYKKWYVKNQPALREASLRRRELYGASEFTQEDWNSILDYFNYSCAYCLRLDVELTMDHMVPVSRGGEHTKENIVPSCKSCNSTKGDRSIFTMLNRV